MCAKPYSKDVGSGINSLKAITKKRKKLIVIVFCYSSIAYVNGCQVSVPFLDKWIHIYGTNYHHLRDAHRV